MTRIGVFDSGVGGLTVYRELLQVMPDSDFIYLGDTARVPYGIRSAETIRKYSLQNCLFLIEKGAEIIVVACNTATALALPFLQEVLKVPVLGVVEPGARSALEVTKKKKIGVIATEATIRSQVYEKALQSLDAEISCFTKATPLFVPLVEEGLLKEEILFPVFDHYLRSFLTDGVDTLILGCTHYPILKAALDDYFSGRIQLVDSARATAESVRDFVTDHPELKLSGKANLAQRPLYVTDAPERVARIAGAFLGTPDVAIEKVEV